MPGTDARPVLECLGLITARRGSRGLPDKHLRPLGGRPLVAWTFDAALGSRMLTRLVLSTDDDRIIALAEAAGIEVPFHRPASLAADETPHLDVVRHALDWYAADAGAMPRWLVLLQPTSPFRTARDIDDAVARAEKRSAAVVGVCECQEHPARCYRIEAKGLMPFDARWHGARRQDLPPVYRVNGAIYVSRPDQLLQTGQFVPPGALPYLMPVTRSVDIDTEADLAWAEFCLASGRVKPEVGTGS
jgi:N-acylneuraminate cytidylyltransferase